ncbi:MAG: DMT family transporter [Clostridia bacterium]|nr:DMT family transporter [Clostridia bacterium]
MQYNDFVDFLKRNVKSVSITTKRVFCAIALVAAAFFWGTTFVAQSDAADVIGPFTFNGIRSIIGSVALLPLALAIGRAPKNEQGVATPFKKQLLYGSVCGLCLFLATNLQQIGIAYTTAGKSGFVTALYVVLVPVFGLFFLKKKIGWNIWIAVLLSAVGLYLLCVTEGFTIQKGDTITFFCAIVFAWHILAVDSFSDRIAGVTLSCIQFFVSGVLSLICMFIFEDPRWSQIIAAAFPLLYAGILSCGVAYTLQIVGQKHTDPTIASILMSLESVFAVLAGWAVRGEILNSKETIGCIVMFGAIVLSQLPLAQWLKIRKEKRSLIQ